MPIPPRILAIQDDMRAWRHRLHRNPETAFEEHETAAFVASKLAEFGLDVETGIAVTGIVATLRGRGNGSGRIALRADMDALHISEASDLSYRSTVPGKMHACGHDGHTAMLLGAAKHLSEARDFSGTVHFIFQPAEENEGGGRRMIEENLFEKYPVDQIYGLHNWPGLDVGTFSTNEGPLLASYDIFEIDVQGKGCHAAMPELGIDPIVMGSQIVLAIQSIASRIVAPRDAVVVSVTQIHGGDTWNVMPDRITIRGTVRAFRETVQDRAESALRQISENVAAAYGGRASLRYERRYPPTVNASAETDLAIDAASALVGAANVSKKQRPLMNAEDFAFMLRKKPGCYMLIGNGPDHDGCQLHSPRYRFNDEILALGAGYWVSLVERLLPLRHTS